MKKLKQIIDRGYNEGKIPRGLSLTDFRLLESIYISLTEKRSYDFIQATILPILDRCKIKYKVRGIGWIVGT